ncbi:hypothetical protein PC118_g14135 [Phytophthora cactorum]|uniref:Uncharacterized protein n=1 Tax=Phytophthora cactorum TaxID=29920 RepID=A0A8T1FM07_9STRA|nr:hypothetical protein PC118_g14135 [Phytophthora cactorum]
MEQKEVQECLNAVQGEQQLPSAEAVPQDATVQVDPEETRKIIDRSIQSAVDVICKTIRDEVREVTARAAQPKPQVSSVNHGNTTKDDKSDGDDEDYELERRMQEAWRKTYLVVSSSVSQPEASTDQEPSKTIVRVSQNSTCSTDNESSGEIIAVSPRSSAHREPNQAQEYAQQQTNSPRHDEPQAERVNLRSVVSEIQLQIAVRAEMAARRYLSKKAAISELPIDVRNTPSTPIVPSATPQTPATGSGQGSGGDRKPSHPEATVPSGRGNVFTQSMDSMSACVTMQRRTLRTASTIFVGSTRSGTSRSRASTLAS